MLAEENLFPGLFLSLLIALATIVMFPRRLCKTENPEPLLLPVKCLTDSLVAISAYL